MFQKSRSQNNFGSFLEAAPKSGILYSKTTHDITVMVESTYLEAQSSPENSQFIWAYRVMIENKGSATLQLCSRLWCITDTNGLTQEIEGEGVIGETPILNPGESFEYTSGTPLTTPGGFMTGHYIMKNPDGINFTVDIPSFSLDSPYQNKVIH